MNHNVLPRLLALSSAALLLAGCSKYEIVTKEEIAQRIEQEVARRESAIREETRRSVLAEVATQKVAAAVADAPDEQPVAPDSNLRKTRWGMSQQEVITAEGSNYLQRTDSALLYKVSTARLPSVIKYVFEEGTLVKADIYFSDPRLARVLPLKSSTSVESDFGRIHELLSNKYGPAKITTNLVSKIKELKRKKERLDDSLDQYQRQHEDLNRERDRKRDALQNEYRGWKNASEIIDRALEGYKSQIQRSDDWIRQIRRQQEDIDKEIREEEYRERDGKLPKSVDSRWYRSGSYDVTLSMSISPQGAFLWTHYNGFVSDTVSLIPSDL